MSMEWLLIDDEQVDQRFDMSMPVDLNSDVMTGRFENLSLKAECNAYLNELSIKQDIALEVTSLKRPEPRITGNILIDGGFRADLPDGGSMVLDPQTSNMLRIPEPRMVFHLRQGQIIKQFSYDVSAAYFERSLDGRIPKELEPFFKEDQDESYLVELAPTSEMKRIALSALTCSLNGTLRKFFVEGAILQLVALQGQNFQQLQAEKKVLALTKREQQRIHEARQLLLEDLAVPPSLSELASLMHLSEKKLNAGFKLLFGVTVFEMLRDERLDAARKALETEEVSLKQVAFRVGYQHSNNFIKAFTKRYGVPPRQYKNQLR